MALMIDGLVARVSRLLRRADRANVSQPRESKARSRIANETGGSGRAEARSAGEPRASRAVSGGTTYRADPGTTPFGDRWDPYAPEQSRSSRARAARERANARPIEAEIPELYTLLGVAPDASALEIERAYRRQVVTIHPDRYFAQPHLQREAEAKLRRLNDAMTTLRDGERRMRYDAQWRDR